MYIACPRYSKLGDVRKESEIYSSVDGTGFLEDHVGSVEGIVEPYNSVCVQWKEGR